MSRAYQRPDGMRDRARRSIADQQETQLISVYSVYPTTEPIVTLTVSEACQRLFMAVMNFYTAHHAYYEHMPASEVRVLNMLYRTYRRGTDKEQAEALRESALYFIESQAGHESEEVCAAIDAARLALVSVPDTSGYLVTVEPSQHWML